MNAEELYNAVMASPGPLEDEIMAEIISKVYDEIYDRVERSYTREGEEFLMHQAGAPFWRRYNILCRPDISTDAALELVQVRFPTACCGLYKNDDGNWTFELGIHGQNYEPDATHKDRRLAILAALLKAMEGAEK